MQSADVRLKMREVRRARGTQPASAPGPHAACRCAHLPGGSPPTPSHSRLRRGSRAGQLLRRAAQYSCRSSQLTADGEDFALPA